MNKIDFEKILSKVAENLDIPEYLFVEAVEKYEEITSWLGSDGSLLLPHEPIAYPQGSFRLGTVIRPITDNDQYDIDFVCRLNFKKESITKADLKKKVGDQLKKSDEFEKILEEKGRCWTLNFSDIFHVDVLPCIPNEDDLEDGILLTDRDLKLWQTSNPINYSSWFFSRMESVYRTMQTDLAKSRGIDVESVEDWQIRTPLQRTVQILKRHRDIYFERNGGEKPASIVITTLASKVYAGESSLSESLKNVINGLDGYIEKDNGKYVIKSPVSNENFADKWNEDEARVKGFYSWLSDLREGLLRVLEALDVNGLEFYLGERLIKKSHMLDLKKASGEMSLPEELFVPELGDTSHEKEAEWSVVPQYSADVICAIYTKNKKRQISTHRNEIFVPRNRHLRFEVFTDTPGDFDVKWQVVNTGAVAKSKKDGLRGDFYDSDEGLNNIRWEHSEYVGTHYIEAFIIKSGKCVARSGRFYVRIRKGFF